MRQIEVKIKVKGTIKEVEAQLKSAILEIREATKTEGCTGYCSAGDGNSLIVNITES